ncbi:MAG: hypothetical protein HN726_02095 [Candidatus Magasanikbacteria bacterium]|jgi:L-ascorbate metabolism protein UlaG (beta-lactamase superfamily)|nr:hypothetical protein [Candidatus Magasanikbacteria bacterium]MBT4220694.1 hypothetical protein [Candidatus Magasanikbacteria bacterium]MBT4350357.1 hypothetical protein [Candidatus Magasanikbacteria bacterium]MBT4541765.1 hypothetical protein [Candidatus Magasanikbacteria bacterium]MBT6252783.1 hypothetical protein [Candidatus Magasanikbacteria bacterium]
MHISWLGSTAFRIQTKPDADDVVVVIDPYKPKEGTFPRSLTPQIALFTRGEEDAITLSADPFTLSHPGEIETKGVLVTTVQGHEKNTLMIRVDSEHMSIGHVGHISKPLTDEQLEVISGVDILCVPVGGKDCFNAEAAVKMVNTIEPRIVIPMSFKSDNDPEEADVSAFLNAIGAPNDGAEKKVIIKHKDLPQEETRIIVLAKE